MNETDDAVSDRSEKPRRPFLIMGVVNVTPDSFSDGGDFSDPDKAVRHARALAEEGADFLDIGAESTRPGATPVTEDEEWKRLEPVLQSLLSERGAARLSVDTRKPQLMRKAAELGVDLINDVHGGADEETLAALAERRGLHYLAMHMTGDPQTMQARPLKASDAVETVDGFFEEVFERLLSAGFSQERIWLDPGIGFGKTDGANLRLMANVVHWSKFYQVAVGVSRKSLLGRTLGLESPKERDAPSKTLELGLAMAGARLVRTHDVKTLARLRQGLEDEDA